MAIVVCPCCIDKPGFGLPLPPSDRHAAAEALFVEVIAKEVALTVYRTSLCDTVQELDTQVQRGLVRRQASACIASATRPVLGTYPSNLLRCVLQAERHKAHDCMCLETVLAWGCCPTLVALPPDTLWVDIVSALNMANECLSRRKQWMRALLSFGSIPCRFYMAGDEDATGHATLVPLHDNFTFWMDALMLQWKRWHPRTRKRRWIALTVPLV